ncbi:FecR domain-containing protein [Draconibacterium sp.]|jgi:ferric-dicitrate binding protein FerR (iron transport regulator)
MDIKKQDIEKAIGHFIQGNAGPEMQKILLDWLKENPKNQKILFGGKDLWDASQLGSSKLKEIEVQQWIKFQERISVQNNKITLLKEIFRMVAVVVISIGLGWTGHYLYTLDVFHNKQVELKTIEAMKGQLKEIFLADGTHVWLNSDSKLSFPSEFSEKTREIELQGEAFFEVTANVENPFIVKTKNHKVKVTGTKFNICEYPESKIIETTLVEGKVKIITGNITKDIFPGQQASFNTATAEIRINKTDFEIYTAWTEGKYDFKNEPIGKVFRMMERWWDVQITYPESELKNEKISGVLRKHKSLEQHFEAIKHLVPIKYEIGNDIVKVSLK